MADETSFCKLVNPAGTGPILRNDQGAGAGADRDFITFKKGGSEVFSVNSGGLPDPGGGDAKEALIVSYGDLPADADAIVAFLAKMSHAIVVTNIYVAVNADTADGTSNAQQIEVKRSSDDAVLATYSTAAENPGLADETWQTMGDVSNTAVAADERLYAAFTKTASGLAMNGLTFLIEYTLAE
jgi:hypothetical protein